MNRIATTLGIVLASIFVLWFATRRDAPRALEPIAPAESPVSAAFAESTAQPVETSSERASATRASNSVPLDAGTIRGRGVDESDNALDLAQAHACLEDVRAD